MLSVVKVLLKGEVGVCALNSHGNYIVDHGKSWKNHGIEEFPIIGFYLYHVTLAGQSSNWTTSGIKQHILTV